MLNAAAECFFWALLLERRVRFRAGLLVPTTGCRCRVLLEGAAVLCALCSWPAGAAAGCRCKVSVLGAAAALKLACWCRCKVPLQGCRVLLSKGCLHLRNLGAATGHCCQRAVCAMKLGCWCRFRGRLRDVYGSMGVGPSWRLRFLP